MFCTKCGTAIRNNGNFCENCGKMLAPGSQMPRPLPYEVDLDKISMSGSSSNPPAPGASQVFRYNGNSYAQGRPNYRNQGCIVFFVSLPAIDARDIYYVSNGDLSSAGSAFWGALLGVGTMLGCLIDLIIISVRQNIKRR